MEVFKFHSQAQQQDCSDSDVSMCEVADVGDLTTSPKPQTDSLDPGHCSSEKVESNCVTKTSSHNNQDNMKDKDVASRLSPPPDSVSDCLPRKVSRRSLSVTSEEESFFFSDLDEGAINEQFEGSFTPEYIDKEDSNSYENDTEMSRVISNPIVIPRNENGGEEVGQHTGSLPTISAGNNSMGQHVVRYRLSQSLDSTFPGKDDLKYLKSDEFKGNQLSHDVLGAKDYHNSVEFKSALELPSGKRSCINYHCKVFVIFVCLLN